MVRQTAVRVSPTRASVVLLACVGALASLHLAGAVARFVFGHDHLYGLVRQFDMDEEANLPTYFSSLLLLMACALLFVVAGEAKQRRAPGHRLWLLLSALFLLLSADEVCSLHEIVTRPLIERYRTVGLFAYSLVVVGTGVAVVLTAAWGRKLSEDLSPHTRIRFAASAAVYLGAALGLEMVGVTWALHHGRNNIVYALLVTPEETLEMVGVVIFIDALLRHLRGLQVGALVESGAD